MKCYSLIPVLVGVCLPSHLFAATFTYDWAVAPPENTNWEYEIPVPQFDPADGTLNSITFSMSGSVLGDVGFEHLATEAPVETITAIHSALMRLWMPTKSSLILSIEPETEETYFPDCTGYDENTDYGGSSGFTWTDLSASASDSIVKSSDLDPFKGTGTIYLPVRADGASSVWGSGNFVTDLRLKAGVAVRITYDYTPVPEIPVWGSVSALAMLAFGLVRRFTPSSKGGYTSRGS